MGQAILGPCRPAALAVPGIKQRNARNIEQPFGSPDEGWAFKVFLRRH
jgi:hypothetical protein